MNGHEGIARQAAPGGNVSGSTSIALRDAGHAQGRVREAEHERQHRVVPDEVQTALGTVVPPTQVDVGHDVLGLRVRAVQGSWWQDQK